MHRINPCTQNVGDISRGRMVPVMQAVLTAAQVTHTPHTHSLYNMHTSLNCLVSAYKKESRCNYYPSIHTELLMEKAQMWGRRGGFTMSGYGWGRRGGFTMSGYGWGNNIPQHTYLILE
jgi:hypothetical protein